eukprot:GCRY01002057.1.p1 GENE.GCRY01002057.1~~GCRY01002057.1.p1  ORF type:complete len:332 (-),score=19.18 GCRY01002057.1:48-1043(-)
MYKTYVRPRIEYGSEVWMLNKIEENAAEAKQMMLMKGVLKLPKRMSNCVIRGDCELETLKIRRDLRMMKQWARGVTAKEGSLLRVCTEMKYAFRGAKKSWPRMIEELMNKYKLEDEARKMIRKEILADEFVKIMKKRVEEHTIEEWMKEVRGMKNGRYLRIKKKYGIEDWMKENWNEGKRIKMMWRSNASGLMEERWRRTKNVDVGDDEDDVRMRRMEQGICPMCLNEEEETVEHVLMTCSKYSGIREAFDVVLKAIILEKGKEGWLKELKDWDEDMRINVLVGVGSILPTAVRTTVTDQIEQLLQKCITKENSKFLSTALQSSCVEPTVL